ncbi:hypothetical protein QTG56_19270 [Rossellomorea sp. AcN35-11]|nr:hypothetical protein [Rossellomorea aquimaris]WJV29103.1 hypothetical protein QTG56_19270 [Rossellomorea sp. AcN35-11]
MENFLLKKHKEMLYIKLGLSIGIDFLFVVLIASFLFTGETVWNHYVPTFGLMYLLLLTYIVISVKLERFNHLLLYTVLVLGGGAGIFLFGVSWVVLLSAGIYLHWKISLHIQNSSPSIEISSGNVLIFLFISVASLLSGSIRQLENSYLLYLLIFVFFAIIGVCTSVQRMLSSDREKAVKNLYKPLVLLMTVTMGLGVLAAFSSVVSRGLYWLLEQILRLISFMVNPIFNVLIKVRDLILEYFQRNPEKGSGSEMEQQSYDESQLNALGDGWSFPWLNELLMGILICFALFYVIKKRQASGQSPSKTVMSSPVMIQGGRDLNETLPYKQVIYSKASDAVRTSMERLESEAHRYEAGRLPNESARDWFARIRLQENERFFTIYEKVRYGDRNPDKVDVDFFTSRICDHIESLNTRLK